MVNPFSNPIYLLSPLVVAAIILGLVALVLLKSRREFNAWIFCLLLMSIALVCLALFGMRTSPDVHRALPWEKAIPIFGFAHFLFFYHFTLAYTNTHGLRGILYTAYLVLAVVAVLGPTDLIVKEVRLEYYGYAPVIGPLTPLLFICYIALGIGAIYTLFKAKTRLTSYIEKNRITYLAIAGVFMIVGDILDAFSPLPPMGLWCYLVFCSLCTVAVLKYHLLDVSLVVRKGLVYLILSLMVATPYVAILYVAYFTFHAALEPWWAHAIIVMLLAIFLRPLYSRAQLLIDRAFYRERYDYLKALEQLVREAQFVNTLTDLSSIVVRMISGAMQTPHVHILLLSEVKAGFTVVSSSSSESNPSEVVLRRDSPLVKWLGLHGQILSSRDLDFIPQLQSFSHNEKTALEGMGAELYVPMKSREGHLSGMMILGQKLSEQLYSAEDRHLLSTAANHLATTLENVQLFDETRKSEKELREKEREYRELAESFTDIFFAMDEQLRYTYWNKASEQLTGISAESALGKRLYDIFPNNEATRRAEEAYLEVLKTKQPRCFINEYRIRDKDFIFEINVYRSRSGLSVFAKDITEIMLAEQREKNLQERLNLSSRLASIGELAAGVAHEINNPLTGIIGFSQRLLRKSTDPTIRRDLEIVYEEAGRAARVVENLRTFARRTEPNRECVNINTILEKALEMRMYELSSSNIQVVTDLAPELPEIQADFHQIQQVFLNIILNAEQVITEANDGGRLSIETHVKNNYVTVTFADDGPGIPEENFDKLFDLFFTTRADNGGTGLGLSICHGIVTGHGGNIYAKSKLGEGTTFFVELSITDEQRIDNTEPGK